MTTMNTQMNAWMKANNLNWFKQKTVVQLEELQNKISLHKIVCLNEIKQFLSENKCDELCLKFEKLTMDCTEILNKKFQKLNVSELNSK